MRLLVAEDEPKIGIYLQQGLTEAGFNVDRFTNGTEALQHALSEAYDLLILDVMMPGLDGWEVLQKVRSAGKDVPVLFLTARDRVEDRVKGLELGADDYLIKPFAFSELLARVRTLLRRGNGVPSPTSMKLADLEVDLLKRRAIRGKTHRPDGQRVCAAGVAAPSPGRSAAEVAHRLASLGHEFRQRYQRNRGCGAQAQGED